MDNKKHNRIIVHEWKHHLFGDDSDTDPVLLLIFRTSIYLWDFNQLILFAALRLCLIPLIERGTFYRNLES